MALVIVDNPRRDLRENQYGFREKDITIPRPSFTGNTDSLLFSQITGGQCIAHERVLFSDTNHGGLALFDAASMNEVNGALYALITLVADATGDGRAVVAKWKANPMVLGWKYYEDDKTLERSWQLLNTDDHVNPLMGFDGMPLGDGATFEVRGRSNMENFRIIGCEAGKAHNLYVAYYA